MVRPPCQPRFERDFFSPTNFQVENEMSSVRERTARQKEVARKGILSQPAGVRKAARSPTALAELRMMEAERLAQ